MEISLSNHRDELSQEELRYLKTYFLGPADDATPILNISQIIKFLNEGNNQHDDWYYDKYEIAGELHAFGVWIDKYDSFIKLLWDCMKSKLKTLYEKTR